MRVQDRVYEITQRFNTVRDRVYSSRDRFLEETFLCHVEYSWNEAWSKVAGVSRFLVRDLVILVDGFTYGLT